MIGKAKRIDCYILSWSSISPGHLLSTSYLDTGHTPLDIYASHYDCIPRTIKADFYVYERGVVSQL